MYVQLYMYMYTHMHPGERGHGISEQKKIIVVNHSEIEPVYHVKLVDTGQ